MNFFRLFALCLLIHTLKPDQRNQIAKRSRSGSDPFFSGQQKRSPVWTRIMGERNAITNRRFSERDLTSHAPDHRYGLLFSLPNTRHLSAMSKHMGVYRYQSRTGQLLEEHPAGRNAPFAVDTTMSEIPKG